MRPMKRRGNRRYYQHHEVLMIRRIRDLLYDQGFTIIGARNKLQEVVLAERERRRDGEIMLGGMDVFEGGDSVFDPLLEATDFPDFDDSELAAIDSAASIETVQLQAVRRELNEIRDLLATGF